MKPPTPHNEAQRLETLRSFGILDTLPEREFDDLALLASQICGTPMAMVSLIDADRQWFKAKIGVAATQTPRDLAFCAHAILQADLFIIHDALEDERFLHNPFVTGDPRIRFYAGAPLLAADGQALGTLCVLDRVPRELTAKQEESLRALSRLVVSLLEVRRARSDLERLRTAERTSRAAPSRLEDLERRHIEEMLHQSGGVIEGPRGAARVLGLHPNTLRSRMKKLGIKRSAGRAPAPP